MITRTLVLTLLLAVPAAAGAQVVRGIVLEEEGGVQITGATIELLHADSSLAGAAQSDQRGWFHIEAGSPGRYLLRPTHPSYAARGLDTVTVGPHEIVTVIVRMGRAAIPLAPLVVTARTRDRLAGFFERSQQKGLAQFIHRPYIESRVALQPTELLRMTPGVRVVKNEHALRINQIVLRGTVGSCPANVYLDGLLVPTDSVFTVDDITAADVIQGIEIYQGGAVIPPEFQAHDNTCGVVAFWTMRDRRGPPFSWKRLGLFFVGVAALFLYTRS